MHRPLPALTLLLALGVTGSAGAATTLEIDASDTGGNGTANGASDRFRIVRNGSLLEVYLEETLAHSADLASLSTVTIAGSADDDTLTVDFSGGNPVPSGGLVYHGAANATETGDTLRLENGSIASVSYRFFTETDGAVDVDGRTITYTGLEPVIDLVPSASLIVNATGGSNSITYRVGTVSAANGLVAVDGFETIEFANKTTLVLNGNDGIDDIVLANPNVPTGLTSVTVNGGNGNDTMSVYIAAQAATLNGDGGDDLFRVAPSAAGIAVDGGAQILGDLLMVDATAGKARDTDTAVEVEGFAPVDYVDVEGVQRISKGKQRKILKKRLGF